MSRARRRLRLVVLAVTVLLAIAVVRVLTISVPHVSVHTTAASTVHLSGSAPHPDWPHSGQATLAVQGVGSLGSSGGQRPRPIASITKVMTAYLILKKYPLSTTGRGFTLTLTRADANAEAADAAQDESVVSVAAGERLDERQLLEALLIPSGDNIADILATYSAGSVSAFVAEMNREARSLGMDHTTYTDDSGFAPSTVSTASDQLGLFEQAIRLPVLRQIVSMPSVTLPVAGTVMNFDPLIADGYDGKTGSDSEAEGCLAFFRDVTVGGRRLRVVGVVLGQGEGSTTSVILGAAGDAASALVSSVLPAVHVRTVLPAGSAVMAATSAAGDRTRGVTTSALRVIGWGGQTERLRISPRDPGTGLKDGQRLGEVQLTGDLPVATGRRTRTEVRAAARLSAPGLGWRLSHLF